MGIDNILIYHPESYHGEGKKNFFEGWYFKNTSSNGSYVFAIIPGISIGSDSHSFIQVIDNRGYSKYFRFEFSDFKFSNKPFWVKIKDNYFSLEKIKINLENFEGQLIFKGLKPWPVSIFSPGVMGPFGFLNFLECYHGILSFNHKVRGYLKVNGKEIDFNNGKGYIEKDWGISFPKSWIWSASNDFEKDESISISIATVPFFRNYFVGFIIGLYVRGKLYKFTTYNGSKIKNLEIFEDKIFLTVQKRKYKINVEIIKSEGNILIAPRQGEMVERISESLNAKVKVKLYKGDELLFAGIGKNAGLEVVGNIIDDMKIRL
ncbi:MAG: tocopherol cyclase [Thermosipho sp. (in: thermotogales)]|jgi:hypothetical protein|nr:tocopherol cyclase [Thermosipho sp. (in: thermotogales)]MDK2899558.1 tocopherol cyclase [Thermosipho sp. (in: thermotogales)]